MLRIIHLARKNFKLITLGIRLYGLATAIQALLQYQAGFPGQPTAGAAFNETEYWIRGVPVISIFRSFVLIAFGSFLDALTNAYKEHEKGILNSLRQVTIRLHKNALQKPKIKA